MDGWWIGEWEREQIKQTDRIRYRDTIYRRKTNDLTHVIPRRDEKERLDRQSSCRIRLFGRSGVARWSSRGRFVNGESSSINVLCSVVKTACFSWESQVDCQRVLPSLQKRNERRLTTETDPLHSKRHVLEIVFRKTREEQRGTTSIRCHCHRCIGLWQLCHTSGGWHWVSETLRRERGSDEIQSWHRSLCQKTKCWFWYGEDEEQKWLKCVDGWCLKKFHWRLSQSINHTWLSNYLVSEG